MATTDDLVTVIDRLRTDTQFVSSFESNPVSAISSYLLTGHERRALVARDSDDFVALGLVDNISELPEPLRGSRVDTQDWIDRLRRELEKILKKRFPPPSPDRPRLPRPRFPMPGPIPGPIPGPLPGPGPGPGPRPGPGPGPRPGPGPGPDPPMPRGPGG